MRQTPRRERAIGELARSQHGVVALGQLEALGLKSSAVRARVDAGRWERVHAGIVATGHVPLARNGRFAAAVLACGEQAALCHRSCAALRGLRPSARADIDVMSPKRTGRKRRGIDAHSAATLHPSEVEIFEGIRCTTVARTLLDLAEVVDRRALERAIDQAEVLRVLDMRSIEATLARAIGRRGAPLLRSVLDEHRPATTLTRSELEELFLAICRDADLPPPEVNPWLALPGGGPIQPDFYWRAQRLVVELDGRARRSKPTAGATSARCSPACASCAAPGARSSRTRAASG